MIICQCAAVSDAAIARLIQEGVHSLVEITNRTGAGRCCAPCREAIGALLDAAGHRRDAAPLAAGQAIPR